ncbi:winged helix-turn-helix domain-containing protein [Halobaculum rubrum]|uniref:winged helix-turn-helix domain-containing protein n=1 Tax=Halobaculum rubrum TaxID=2872158 RepID=UPI001CA41840|nr:helix-turn-helix domain-containing protein [Halobaculum rubrum]QZX99776.1 helix-turn-helix domain-containing protein [Halobaculum rubrum]
MSRSAEEAVDHAGEADLDPAEAFALLGNETRIDILQSLHEATIERGDDQPVAFSELYDRTDLNDSAHFNYHLKQLLDHFVRKIECGDDAADGDGGSVGDTAGATAADDCVEGYEFRTPGWKVVRSVFAGTFTGRSELGPFDAPGACYECDGDLEARYANELLTIACTECGRTPVNYSFPPGGLADRTPAEFLDAFHHHVRHHYCLAADGVCPECMGRMETDLVTETAVPGQDVAVRHTCGRCDNRLTSAVGVNLLDTAPVLTFFAERGVDLTTEPFWTHPWTVSDGHTRVVSEDPLRVRLDLPCDGDVIRVTVDETLEVLDAETNEPTETNTADDDVEADA